MLEAPAIRELSLESDTWTALAEWLAKYFDGGLHDVGGNAQVKFPKAVLRFGQSILPQPLNPARLVEGRESSDEQAKAAITAVWGSPIGTAKHWQTVDGQTQQVAERKVRWNFWVRCEMQDAQEANARKVCRQTAERLSGLLGNAAATRELGQCGIHRVRPGEPEPVAETGFILMLVTCRATLRYAVLSQG